MAAKKAVNLSKLPFSELKDKAKDLPEVKAMNRFEMTQALKKADSQPTEPDTANPRAIKPEIKTLKAKLAETPKAEQKERKKLQRSIAKLKRGTRQYL